jgi:hypothetical protein
MFHFLKVVFHLARLDRNWNSDRSKVHAGNLGLSVGQMRIGLCAFGSWEHVPWGTPQGHRHIAFWIGELSRELKTAQAMLAWNLQQTMPESLLAVAKAQSHNYKQWADVNMAQKKKLQVFVSSTYADLRDERQAAVEAILTAGHIPAGMELFAAGDQSQMDVIKRWIDESDVFLLILGGRYGSIDPAAEKSYVQLEYEYAQQRGKPFFAIVIKEDYLDKKLQAHGREVFETEQPQKLKDFRAKVLTKLVRFFGGPQEIKLAVMETLLTDFSRRDELVGWIPGDQAVNTGALAEEIARLGKENASLREQLSKVAVSPALFNGLTYEQVSGYLAEKKIDSKLITDPKTFEALESITRVFGDSEPSLLHLFWFLRRAFLEDKGIEIRTLTGFLNELDLLDEFGLIGSNHPGNYKGVVIKLQDNTMLGYSLTDAGRKFFLRLRLDPRIEEAPEYELAENDPATT